MRICICGGGSLGHVCAGVLASQEDIQLSIYTGHPNQWQRDLMVTDSYGKQYSATLYKISGQPEEVIPDQDIILLCLPGFMIEKTLLEIRPYIGNAKVGSVVSSTGFFFFAHDILDPDTPLFGFQRVPFIARVGEYGKSARLLGYKSDLAVVIENVADRESFRENLERLFLTPTRILDNFYEAALTNSNPILHTGRLFTMFQGNEEVAFDHKILFYREWTDEASRKLIDMDEEFFRLLDVLKVTSIPTLLDYYESTDAASLTQKLRTIDAFKTIESPMKEVPGGWMVDFTSRYFTEDFPFGLRWIKELAQRHQVDTPIIDEVYSWGMSRL